VKDYSQLASVIAQSRQTLSPKRASVIAASFNKIEANLTLLGATGVEDQLQDGVQETLESLRAAGIKVFIQSFNDQCMFIVVIIIIIIIIIIFCVAAAQRRLWLPRSRGFLITHNNMPQ
jgi:t-SNARE complex subunit (syntaxin)